VLQTIVEHVTDHHHAAARPLPHPAKFGVVELRLIGKPGDQGHRKMLDDAGAEPVLMARLSIMLCSWGSLIERCSPLAGPHL
jgi:hypothetical protein